MSASDILDEAQLYLLDSGDRSMMATLLGDSARELGRALPIFGEVQVLFNTWQAGTYDAATTTYTDATADAQTLGNFPLSTLTAGDGHLLGANGMFGTTTYTVSSPDSDDAVYRWEYWTGQAWLPLTLQQTPDFSVVGQTMLGFDPPRDWARAIPSDMLFPTSVDPLRYWVRMQALTPPALFAAVASLVAVQQAFFPLPESALAVLSAHYYPRELEPVVVTQGMDLLQPAWRTSVGTPTRFTQDVEVTHTLRLLPLPDALGAVGIPPFTGIPGAVAATNHLITFFLQRPSEEGVADWLEGLVALDLAAREATRQGDLHDPALAQSLQGLWSLLLPLLRGLYMTFEHDAVDRPFHPRIVEGVL